MVKPLSNLGKEWQSRLKGFFETAPGADATPLEIMQAVLDDVERRVEPIGRGRRIFPYNRITVRVRQRGGDHPLVASGFGDLPAQVRERLAEIQCESPRSIDVQLRLIEDAEAPDGPLARVFWVDYGRAVEPLAPPEPARVPTLAIRVVKGAASQETYTFAGRAIAIGRTAEPIDERGHVRRNRIAFLDTVDGITETVGRAHARLQVDPFTGAYHLFDEGSSNGTAVIRDGVTIRVAPRDPRGVRIQPGDEIQLGRALILVMPVELTS